MSGFPSEPCSSAAQALLVSTGDSGSASDEVYIDAITKSLAKVGVSSVIASLVHQGLDKLLGYLEKGTTVQFVFLIAVGSAGVQPMIPLLGEKANRVITEWVARGGTLAVSGEGVVVQLFNVYFNRQWTICDSPSTQVVRLNRKCARHVISEEFAEALLEEYSVETVILKGVPANQCLYGQVDSCSVALSRFANGRLCFVGDLYAQVETIEYLTKLATLDSAQDLASTDSIKHKTSVKALIVCGMGCFRAPDDFIAKTVSEAFAKCNVETQVEDVDSWPELIQLISLTKPDFILLVGVGQNGPEPVFPFLNNSVKDAVTTWVDGGGTLVVHGEGIIADLFNRFFDKNWQSVGVSSCGFYLNVSAARQAVSQKFADPLAKGFYKKMNMLRNVDWRECLYRGMGTCSIALSTYGNGRIAHIGDVNCDGPSITFLQELVKNAKRTNEVSLPKNKALIACGLGLFKASDDFYADHTAKTFKDLGIPFSKVDISSTTDIVALIEDETCKFIFLIGVGQAGADKARPLFKSNIRDALRSWVERGGYLAVQGEGGVMDSFLSKVFDKHWKCVGYYREERELNEDCEERFRGAMLPREYSSKAVVISGVSEDETVYGGSDDCSLAMANIGLGRLMLIGDVNAEEITIDVLGEFAKCTGCF